MKAIEPPKIFTDFFQIMDNISEIFQNIDDIKDDAVRFELSMETPICEILARRHIKQNSPYIEGVFLKSGNSKVQLSSYEMGVYSLLVYTYHYQEEIPLKNFVNKLYPNYVNGMDNFKKVTSILNKKMRENFGFKMFFSVKKGLIVVNLEKVTKK